MSAIIAHCKWWITAPLRLFRCIHKANSWCIKSFFHKNFSCFFLILFLQITLNSLKHTKAFMASHESFAYCICHQQLSDLTQGKDCFPLNFERWCGTDKRNLSQHDRLTFSNLRQETLFQAVNKVEIFYCSLKIIRRFVEWWLRCVSTELGKLKDVVTRFT